MSQFILFYSKFSPASSILVHKINLHEAYFQHLQQICVDNKEIRDQITSTPGQFKLSVVPSIFVFQTDVVESYEGDRATLWVDSVILQMKPPVKIEEPLITRAKPPQPPVQPQESVRPTNPSDRPHGVESKTSLATLLDDPQQPNEEQPVGCPQGAPPQTIKTKTTATQLASEMQKLREMDDSKFQQRPGFPPAPALMAGR